MGFTPLGGVMMGTRSGDMDPAIVTYLASKTGKTADEIVTIMNKKSGYLGVSGVSSDARDVMDAMAQGNKRAVLARKIHVNTICNYIGQYFVELGGVDAIVFTAGLGENDIAFKNWFVNSGPALGVKLDERRITPGRRSCNFNAGFQG